jgi:ankyrin repeat protein
MKTRYKYFIEYNFILSNFHVFVISLYFLYFDRVIDILLKQSPRVVNVKNRDESTALHLAVSNGHLDVVKVF